MYRGEESLGATDGLFVSIEQFDEQGDKICLQGREIPWIPAGREAMNRSKASAGIPSSS